LMRKSAGQRLQGPLPRKSDNTEDEIDDL
jgi:hypothetical protein